MKLSKFFEFRSLAMIRENLLLPLTLPAALREFFHHRIEPEKVRDELKRGIENRADRFLHLARTEIYDRPSSPYLQLLRIAGCGYSDLAASVKRDGLEPTLSELARNGVYLTDAEFKGKKDIVRSGRSFRCSLEDFEPAFKPRGFLTYSSGTTGPITLSFNSLPWVAKQSLVTILFCQAHDLLDCRHASLDSFSSGSHGLFHSLALSKAGICPERRFARDAPKNLLARTYHRLIAGEVTLAGRWFGAGFPFLESVSSDQLDTIVQWADRHHRNGQRTCIRAVASTAARLARVAWQEGTSLEGLTFIVSGEPMTTGKQAVIERTGAKFAVMYGFTPGSIFLGFGCACRRHIDEMHVDENNLAVIEHPNAITAGGQSVRPLLISTLDPSERYLRLNTENGDYANLERRACGCPLGKVGMTQLVHHVGSHEKFTSEGLNYDFSPLFNFVEEILPGEFGGGIGDYQIIEEEDEEGKSHLTMLVHPQVGSLDETSLHSRFIEELAKTSKFAARFWQSKGTVQVRRDVPLGSTRGKILPIRRVISKGAENSH
jgi:hypothetical protein